MAVPNGLPLEVLKNFHQAYLAGGHASLAQAISAYAAQTGLSTAAVWSLIRGSSYHVATRSLTGVLTPLVREAITKGLLTVGDLAAPLVPAASGFGAWWIGLSSIARIAIGGLAGTLLVLGGYWVAGEFDSDAPLIPVDRTAVPFTNPNQTTDSDPVYVGIGAYADGQLAIISVRRTEEVSAGIAWCNFHLGGTDCTTNAPTKVLTAPYDNPIDATRELCAMLTGAPYPPALSDGFRAPIGAGNVVVDDWSALDLGACAAAAGG